MATQYDIVDLPSVTSTQDEVRERMDAKKSPVLVVAAQQTAGRGRQGRVWAQPDRGMYASYGFVSEWDHAERTLIPLIAAVAMRTALQDLFDVAPGLKWPNDLVIDGAKVGGILVEASGDDVIVGCGVNVWWGNPMEGAGSLTALDPGGRVVRQLAEAWVGALIGFLGRGSTGWPREAYESSSVTLGHEVSWEDGTGTAVGIADSGALVVEHNGEQIELHAGEVHTRNRR